MDLYINGYLIERGEKVKDFRGEFLYYAGVAEAPSPGKSGKCYFTRLKKHLKDELQWSVFYPTVVNGEIK